MHFNSREEIIALTPHWTGERLPDGRPKVADRHLKALHSLTLEEVWKPIFVKGYESQFEGRLQILHDDGRKLVGRALGKICSAILAPSTAASISDSSKVCGQEKFQSRLLR